MIIKPVGPSLATANTWRQAQSAPLRDGGGQVYNCQHPTFGAIGNGTIDDAPAIQAAITAAGSAGGGTALLPPGTYKVGQQIVLASNVHLAGSGIGRTKVVLAAGAHAAAVQMQGMTHASVRNLTVDVRTNSPLANGITMELTALDGTGVPCTFCTVENCEVLGWDTHQYLIWCQGGVHIKIIHNLVDGNVLVRPASSEQEGIEIQGGLDVLVFDNSITNVGNSGIDPGAAVSASIVALSLDDIRVIGNSINGANVGLFVGGQWSAIHGAATARRVKFLGNDVRNIGLYGFWAQLQAGSQITDLLVQGNTFDSIGGVLGSQGIFVSGETANGNTIALADTLMTTFAHNVVHTVTDANAYGILVQNYPGVRLLDNTIRDVITSAAGGIVLNASTDGTVRGNKIGNVRSTGITIEAGSDRALVSFNEIRDWNTSAASAVGILAQTSARGVLTHNKFYQGTPANDFYNMGVQSSCDHTTVRDNVTEYTLAAAVYSPNANSGTNPSSGTITVTAGVNARTVTNAYCTSASWLRVRQTGGAAAILFYALAGDGAFTLEFKTNTIGDETFAYDIVN